MLARNGVIGWQQALASLTPAAPDRPRPGSTAVPLPERMTGELVTALAALALPAP